MIHSKAFLNNSMKAAVFYKYGPPSVLKVEEMVKPVPKENEVLIKVCAAVVTTADCVMRKGEPYFARLMSGITAPRQKILGTEFAGIVEEVGKKVKNFKTGDEVYAASGDSFGAHAEYITLPEEGALAIKPTNVRFEEAAAICEGCLTALPFLRDKGNIQIGQKVLINGASGSVGTAAVQLAKYFGAKVIGVCSSANLDLVKKLGADKVIDYKNDDFTKNGERYDIIFDVIGKSSYSKCRNSLSESGTYLCTVPSLDVLGSMLWTSKFDKKKAILTFTGLRKTKAKRRDLVFLKKLTEQGKVKPVISKKYKLEEIAKAHEYVETGHKVGNAVVMMD